MTTPTLSPRALNRALLARQMLLAREPTSAVEAVGRLVGLQAQQPAPPFVGLWTRLDGFRRDDLLGPIRSREVVRATTLRGTLHLWTAADYLAFRSTLQPMLSAGMASILRGRAAALDLPALLDVARRALADGPATFTTLRAALMAAVPDGDERAMGYAVRTHLPLVAAPDDSPWAFPADPPFADAVRWLDAEPDPVDRRAELVLRYLAAFGPASTTDVQTWSGLGGLKPVLDALRPRLATFRDARKRELFDLPDAPRPPEDAPAPARFLPGFDNAILAHDDRSRIIADEHRPRVTTKNLLVLPTILVDGVVAGTWKLARAKAKATLTVTPFAPLPPAARDALDAEAAPLARFLEPDAAGWSIEFEPA